MHKGLKRAAGALLIAALFYGLLGYLILPGVALRIANQQLMHYSNQPASLERLQFDPVRLELSLWGLRVGEADPAPLAFERLSADLELDSLWGGALHLARVELEKPHAEVRFDRQGRLNLSQLFKLPEPTPPEEPQASSEPFALRIDALHLSGGNFRFQDLRPSEPVEVLYDNLNLELRNLSTLAEEQAELTLSANAPRGGNIEWRGQLSLVPLSSSGHLQLRDARLADIWPYVRDALPLVLEQGRLSLASDYRLSLADGLQLNLENAQASVAPLALKAADGRALVKLARLDIADTRVDLGKRQLRIGTLRSQKLETWAAREADGQLDWLKLLAPDAGSAAKAAPAQQTPGKAWQVLLADAQLRDYRVHLADRVPQPAVELMLGPLDLDLKDFDSRGTAPFNLRLDTGVGGKGRLKAEGQVQLSPTAAELQISSRDIDLRPAQAYLSPLLRLELRSGQLASDLKLVLNGTAPLAFAVTGSAQVNGLHSLDTLKERDFVRWQRLELDGLDYRHGERLSIGQVKLQQPYGRFIVNEDLTTNLNDLMITQPKPTAAQNSARSSDTQGKPLAIRIGEITIAEGSANFADFSLTPNFATAIQQLNGRIGTLDSRSAAPASVAISGKVDRYAPVSINGSLNPFNPLDSLDITSQFKQVELTTLTPYSGKFAGYRIRKGRLNLDLHYRIDKGQLKAENNVVVEQLQLGEQVDSPSAVDLPVRLAVALLKDSDGRIAIQLPVQGNLNSPDFDVMPIVWKTLRGLVARAVQAPFKFLGGLVTTGSQQDLSSVPFAPGSATLDTAATAGLDTLASALQQRPTLRLEVEGLSAPGSDGPPLAEQRLHRAYQSAYQKLLQGRGETVPDDPAQLQVPEDEKRALLEGIYRSRLKQQPPAEWAQLDEAQRAAKLAEAVLQSWSQSKLLLRQLGQERAASIKAYLVDQGGLAQERIYLLDVGLGDPGADGRVATPLHLDSE
ncbi:DUF748 domain-containing protein [Pseudomonas benzenivorans]|uniref:DUF748 domain-containing protein n=1 Tax=Pseudomonas benzenivorans TaxID=556533 RepID=A0ABY5HCF1_9PSED|nr:DUF748 domain-containing protein [Pseudomonas benzenivorans]UTW09273.1 DUF748 domain-containing protein [Pseudomonas benzenivorans]